MGLFDTLLAAEGGADAPRTGGEVAAPRGALAAARLQFLGGGSEIVVHAAESGSADLYRMRFEGPEPEVRLDGDTVSIRTYRGFHPFDFRRRSADIALNDEVVWDVEVKGGLSRLVADLSALKLRGLEIMGGASQVEITLPEPHGVVPVRVTGGVSKVTVRRPAGSEAAVTVKGGANKLVFDAQELGALGGKSRLTTGGWEAAADRYDIEITGGASKLTVTQG